MRKELLMSGAVIALALSGPALAQTRQAGSADQATQGSVQSQQTPDNQRTDLRAKQQAGENTETRESRTPNRLGEQQDRREDQNAGPRQSRRDESERHEGRREELRTERGTVGRSSDDRYYRSDRDYDRGYREERGRFEGRERYGDRDRYDERGRYGERYDRRYDRQYGRLERGYGERRNLHLSRRARSRIHDVLVGRRVQPANVDFPIRIGTTIPSYVESYDLPREVYDWAPSYEGYRYFETEDDIVIIDPQTMEVVAVLDQ